MARPSCRTTSSTPQLRTEPSLTSLLSPMNADSITMENSLSFATEDTRPDSTLAGSSESSRLRFNRLRRFLIWASYEWLAPSKLLRVVHNILRLAFNYLIFRSIFFNNFYKFLTQTIYFLAKIYFILWFFPTLLLFVITAMSDWPLW
jgi:hypothetical protein